MKFSTFTKSVLTNIITFKNYEAIKSVGYINYYTDDAKGSIKKKEYRWSFDNNYWSSWEVLSQSNISSLNTNNNYYLFLEIRYVYAGSINSKNEVNNFSIDYTQSTIVNQPIEIESSTGSTHIHVYEQIYTKPQTTLISDCNLLNSLPGSYYLNRANHTGTQLISTVDGLSLILQDLASNISIFDNIGNGDVSIYYGKINAIHQFRELKAGSNRIIFNYNSDNTIVIDSSLGDIDASIYDLYYNISLTNTRIDNLESSIFSKLDVLDASITYINSINDSQDASIDNINLKIEVLDSSLNINILKVDVIDSSLNTLTIRHNITESSLGILTLDIDSSILYLSEIINVIDSSLDKLTIRHNITEASLGDLNSIKFDSSILALNQRIDIFDSSLNLLTINVNVTDSSLDKLTVRHNITEASLGDLSAVKFDASILYLNNIHNITESSLGIVTSYQLIIDNSLYILTNRHNITESSLNITRLYAEGLGSMLSLLTSRYNVTEASLGDLSAVKFDASILELSIKHNITESSLGNLTSVKFDTSILYLNNKINVTDGSLYLLTTQQNISEASLGIITQNQLISDNSIYVITSRHNITEASLGNLTSVKFDASILTLSIKLNTTDTSLYTLLNRHNITESSLGIITQKQFVTESSLNILLNRHNITEASLGALTINNNLIDSSLSVLSVRYNITEASLGNLSAVKFDSSILTLTNRLNTTDTSLYVLLGRHNVTESSLNITRLYAEGLGSSLSILTNKHNITESSLGNLSAVKFDASILYLNSKQLVIESSLNNLSYKFDINDASLSKLTNIYYVTETSVGSLTTRLNITDASLTKLNEYVDASLLIRDASITWLSNNKLNGANNIDSCTGSFSHGNIFSYISDNVAYFKKILVSPGISIIEDVSTIRFLLDEVPPTTFISTFVADGSSFVYYPETTHKLGYGPFIISLYENNDQVYVNNNIDSNGNVTLSWILGNLSGTCKVIISL